MIFSKNMQHKKKKRLFGKYKTCCSFCNFNFFSPVSTLCTTCTFSVCMEYPADLLHVYTTQKFCMEYCNAICLTLSPISSLTKEGEIKSAMIFNN